jgi:MOSC domain-containing protein YiiM
MTEHDTPETDGLLHMVLALWRRPTSGGPMEPRDALECARDGGVVGDHTFGGSRHVTLIFEDDWKAATTELGHGVDPSGRRANVLLSGGNGQRLVGRTIRLGALRIEVKSITSPCKIMERAATGLMDALKPDGRGGVWGTILNDGTLRPGDALSVD